jgi:hypothetical protein
MKTTRPDSNKKSILVAISLLMVFACSLSRPIAATAKTETPAATSGAPKTAPDRRLRLLRQETPAVEPENPASPEDAKREVPGGATTVSLQGGVTRLDGTADSANSMTSMTQQRAPLSGRIDSLIDTILLPEKPRSETVPPQTFRFWLENSHPQFALSASSNPEASVVVIKGQWDNSAKTLDKFQIPHVKIGGGKIATFPLDQTRVVIVDCAGDLPRSAHQPLRDFVMRGGYLLSTDWALNNFTAPIFTDRSGREFIQWNKAVNKRDMVDATAFDTDPVLFSHAVTNAYWKLDVDSHLIRVLNRDAVRVLATSAQLRADDPDHAGILAVMFPYGRGYVMHMIGHFDNNAKIAIGNFLPDPAPGIKISLRQALATNFIVAGLTQTRIPTMHKR